MRKLLPILLLLFARAASAADVYFAQVSAGGNTGANCANAIAVGSISWVAGNTYHVCGTVTSQLAPSTSGTAGNVITIIFESGSKMSSSTAWPQTGAINVTNLGFITVDGNNVGIIENTLNGTTGATCLGGTCSQQQSQSKAIFASGGHDITMKNLTVRDMYFHDASVNNNDTFVSNSQTSALFGNNTDNVTITNNTVHDVCWAFTGWGNNWSITHNVVSRIDHGVGLGANSGDANGTVIAFNHFFDYFNWDTTANAYHHDGIHIFAGLSSGGHANDRYINTTINNNIFDGTIGANVTGHIFLEEQIWNTTIFNNTFIVDPSHFMTGTLWFEGRSNASDSYNSGHGVNNAAYNNFTQDGTNGGAVFARFQDGWIYTNNIAIGGNSTIELPSTMTFASGGVNNNVYQIMGTTNTFNFGATFTDNFTTWKGLLTAGSGQDSNSLAGTSGNLNMDSSGHPLTGSYAIGAGANLTSLCTGALTALCSDLAGTARPSTGAWDSGAYQFASGGLVPPTIIRVIRKPGGFGWL